MPAGGWQLVSRGGLAGLAFNYFFYSGGFVILMHQCNRLVLLLALAGAYLFSMPVLAETDAGVRPKIGLALSGGGSRGAAHIGVLRELERQRIPIDYIAGTSVGAIIGGLYAAGMSVEEIEEVVVGSNLDEIFKDKQSRLDTAPRRKFDQKVFQLDKEMGIKDGRVHLPSGLRQGQKLEIFLSKLLLSVTEINNFNYLPIPFRAVATDISTGEAVAIGHGNLVTAIRASMSIPAVFSDVKLDGRILVDGGISNNLPVNVVREMGAEVVIAVDVGSKLLQTDKLDSAIRISLQLTNLMVRRTTQEQIANLQPQDILISPEMGDYSSTNFTHTAQIVPAGELATRAVAEQLEPLAIPLDPYRNYLDRRHPLSERPPFIDTILIQNDTRLADEYIAARIQQKTGERLDFEQLEKDISVLHGMGIFKSVSYDVIDNAGEAQLLIKTIQKPWGPNYLQFGLSYASNLAEENNLAMALGYTVLPTNERSGEWRSIIRLGEELGLFTEYHQPLGLSTPYYVNASLSASNLYFRLYDDGREINSFRDRRLTMQLALGRELSTWGDLRFGYATFKSDVELESGPRNQAIRNLDGGELSVQFHHDTWDSAFFPTRGELTSIRWVGSREGLGADDDFDTVVLDILSVRSYQQSAFLLGAKYADTVSGVLPAQNGFRLGGLFNLPGFSNNVLSGDSMFLLRSGFQHKLGRFLGTSPYAGTTLQYGNVFQVDQDVDLNKGMLSVAAWLGWKTIMGPIYLGYGYVETGDSSIYLEVGAQF